MRAKMLRKLIKWFIQDIFLGTIPLIIHCLILIVIRQRISIILLSAELFFLNIEILISAYKKISKLEWNHRNEEILSENTNYKHYSACIVFYAIWLYNYNRLYRYNIK